MITHFEFEDEKGILQNHHPHDSIARGIHDFFEANMPEAKACYITRRAEGYNYDGTVHTPNETIYIQVVDSTLFILPESLRKDYPKGKPLDKCPYVSKIPIIERNEEKSRDSEMIDYWNNIADVAPVFSPIAAPAQQ